MFIDGDIRKFYKKYVIIGFFIVGMFGTLFHFVYDWSGQVWFVGLFVNIVGTWSIPFLFYGYMGILGFEVAWIDISTFFIAVFIAFALQYHVLINSYKKQTVNCGKTVLIVNLIQLFAFVLLTYRPLNLGIFISPV